MGYAAADSRVTTGMADERTRCAGWVRV